MSIHGFNRSYNRATVSGSGFVQCVCKARAGYRLTSGSRTIYRCPACANGYAAPEWQSEALPHIQREHDALLYAAYVHRRVTYDMTPEQIASAYREQFSGGVEQLEARYQAELAGKRAVS